MSSDFIRRKCGLHFSTNHTVVNAEVAFPSATSVNNELPRIVSATSESKAEDTPSQPTIKSSLTFGTNSCLLVFLLYSQLFFIR